MIKNMKVILLKDVSGVGKKGEVKEFNDGYARNFLIAKNFAAQATPQMLSKIQNEAKQKQESERKHLEQAQRIKADLDKRSFTISVKVGDKGQIFGSVHEKDVAQRISEKVTYQIDKSQIILPKKIKDLGEYKFEIKLSPGIVATPKLILTAKE